LIALNRVKQYRAHQKMSQQELARRIGVSRQTITLSVTDNTLAMFIHNLSDGLYLSFSIILIVCLDTPMRLASKDVSTGAS
jgi:transcriptional regulator with XRE-family HTH domain